MNKPIAHRFAQAERSREDGLEAQHLAAVAAEEARTEALAEIENDLSADAAAVADIVADVIFENDFATKVAAFYATGKTLAAGMYLCERIEALIEQRAICEEARRTAKAREEFEAERAARRAC